MKRAVAVVVWSVVLMATTACKRSPYQCSDTDIRNGDPAMWTVVYSNCGNEKKYGVTCTPDPSVSAAGILQCTCSLDGAGVKVFPFSGEMPSDPMALTPLVNAMCGWTIE
jgi:hypothetical protein